MVELDHIQLGYRNDIDGLREKNDVKFGIVSARVKTGDGDTWVRDATKAFALGAKNRPSHDPLSIVPIGKHPR